MTETMTARHRAAAILSGNKLRMIEAEGIVVVDKPRLALLERLYEAALRRQKSLTQQMDLAFKPDDDTKADREFISVEQAFYQADDDVDAILAELEALSND